MTSIGILGSGRVATALGEKLASAGRDVTVGSLDPGGAAARWSGVGIRHADYGRTAREAAIVINATPGDSTLDRLIGLRDKLDGKILIDLANATERGADGMPGGLCYPGSSLAEELQQALPGTRVVKTLNTMLYTVMVDPRSLAVPPTVFVSGDDDEAKKVVGELLGDLGWPAEWIVDLGGVVSARATEALVLLVPHLFRRIGPVPFAVTIAR